MKCRLCKTGIALPSRDKYGTIETQTRADCNEDVIAVSIVYHCNSCKGTFGVIFKKDENCLFIASFPKKEIKGS